MQTLAVIHTSPTLTPLFGGLCAELMPGVKVFHMVDESLIKETIRVGRLEKLTIRRLLRMIESAEQAGADAILVTCSSIGAGTSIAKQIIDVPVIRVDEAMAEAAVAQGTGPLLRIGVMATLKTTLEPTIALLESKAAAIGRKVEIIGDLCDGAFEAVLAGDTTTHDAILSKALMDMKGVDVIVLAQASMARVVKSLPEGSLGAPVLSSPEVSVRAAKAALDGLARELGG
jgi:Asp/Glu/hydantoin racemase